MQYEINLEKIDKEKTRQDSKGRLKRYDGRILSRGENNIK